MNTVTVQSAMKKYGLSKQTIYAWIRSGKVQATKESNGVGAPRNMIDASSLETYATTHGKKTRKTVVKKALATVAQVTDTSGYGTNIQWSISLTKVIDSDNVTFSVPFAYAQKVLGSLFV